MEQNGDCGYAYSKLAIDILIVKKTSRHDLSDPESC